LVQAPGHRQPGARDLALRVRLRGPRLRAVGMATRALWLFVGVVASSGGLLAVAGSLQEPGSAPSARYSDRILSSDWTRRSGIRSLSGLPAAAQARISSALGSGDPRFRLVPSRAGYRVPVHGGLEFSFTGEGARVGVAGGWLSLGPISIAGGAQPQTLRLRTAIVRANRIAYRRGPVTEMDAVGPFGLEQAFTVWRRPGRAGYLTLELASGGSFIPREAGAGVDFGSRRATAVVRYDGLEATDAMHRQLRARLSVAARRVLITVVDRAAVYPIRIDPYVHVAKLSASDASRFQMLGSSVAMSGQTIAVGADGDNSAQGAVYVFQRPPDGWTGNLTQVAKLVASDGRPDDRLGVSVAMSGRMIVAGALNADVASRPEAGAVYVFEDPSGGWHGTVNEAAKLTVVGDDTPQPQLGYSVAISGQAVVAGAPSGSSGQAGPGTAYVFNEPVTGWRGNVTQAAKLTASDGRSADGLGYSVAATARTVVVGAPGARIGSNRAEGAAYVFTQPPTGWRGDLTQAAKLIAAGGAAKKGWVRRSRLPAVRSLNRRVWEVKPTSFRLLQAAGAASSGRWRRSFRLRQLAVPLDLRPSDRRW
jgi:hypothetical protein